MANKAVFGIATSMPQAERIANQLKAAGFSGNDISVLFPDKTGTRDFAHEQHTKAPEGAAAGASTGGVLGGGLGWLVGIGALAIPGVGPFIAAGPIMAALAGAAVGAAAGGLTGALIGLGIPEYEAKQYEGKILKGTCSFPSTPKTAMKWTGQRRSSSARVRKTFPIPVRQPSKPASGRDA